MWPFKKHIHTLTESGIFHGMTDWHSHILPGVDDGIKTPEDSLAVLRHFEQIGIKKLWLTPHVMEDYPNETSDLQRKFEELKLLYNEPIELNLASENMLDTLFEERLEKKDFLPIGDNHDHLLVETSYFNPPMNMDDLLDKIFRAGYYPLLAHPERYRYMDEEDYQTLRDKGVKFQVNYLSTVGGYGETARKKSEWMLKNGMVNVIGSDLHRLQSFQTLSSKSPKHAEIIEKLRNLSREKV